MTIALQGTPTIYESSSGTLVDLPYPTGIVAGELLIAHIAHSFGTAPTTDPGGWTLAASRNSIDSQGPSIAVWYKAATGSETGTVQFATNATAGRVTGHMMRWSGIDAVTPEGTTEVSAIANSTSLVIPSITTTANSAVLLHSVGILAASSADITGPAGPTKIAGSTGTGRRLSIYWETQAVAGASGTRTFTTTVTLPFTGITMALKAAAPGTGGGSPPKMTATALANPPAVSGGGAATPTLVRCVNDVPGTTTMVVAAGTTDAISARLKVGTNSAVTTGVIYGPAVTPDVNAGAQLTVSGLTAGTAYFYRVALTNASSVESLDTWSTVGEFKTDSVGASNFSIAFASCTNSTDSASMSAIAGKKPDLFLHLGDEWYADGSGSNLANFRLQMGNKKVAPNHKLVYRTSGASFTPSDHDGMNNNSNYGAATTAWPLWNQVYREMNPTTGLPGSTGVYRSFKRGRVRILRIDRRSFADHYNDVDDATKTCLGATQKQWLKDQITAATEPVILIQNADPWIIATTPNDDGWGGYITERDELAAFFLASGKNIAMLGGDMHALSADDGANSPGGVAVFHAAPLYNSASQKGGPYTVGPYPASGTATVQQYGWLDVTDTGSQISIVYKGFSSDNTQRLTLTKTYETPQSGVYAVRSGALALADVQVVRGGSLVTASDVYQVAVTTSGPPVAGPWTLAFEDTFTGSSLSSQWANSWFGGGVMNNVTTSAANVAVTGGELVLTCASASSGALVNTDPSQLGGAGFEFTTGYAEARIWFSGPDSITIYNWPAFWTDGQPPWPRNGEIDIAEPAGWDGANNRMTANYHGPDVPGGSGAYNAGSGTIPGNWANSWHTYGVHRKVGSADFYYDGVLVWSSVTTDGEVPQFLILNMGSSTGATMYGASGTMKVDYVRVWV